MTIPTSSTRSTIIVPPEGGETLLFATPSGLETFFARCAPLFAAQGTPPDIATIVGISAEHGIEYVPPLIGEPPATPAHV